MLMPRQSMTVNRGKVEVLQYASSYAINDSAVTLSGGGDNPASCARSCGDCYNGGFPRCGISSTCGKRYPNGEFPIGCYR